MALLVITANVLFECSLALCGEPFGSVITKNEDCSKCEVVSQSMKQKKCGLHQRSPTHLAC